MSNENENVGIGITDVDKRTGLSCIDIIEHVPFNIAIAMGNLWRCGLHGTRGDRADRDALPALGSRPVQRALERLVLRSHGR